MGRKKVFISYSHRDADVCKGISDILTDGLGLDVWYDTELKPGEKYREKIVGEIKNSELFIILLSNSSVASEWVQDELEYAKKKQLEIIPIMIPGTILPDAFDMMIQRYNIIPYETDAQAMEAAFRRVISTDGEVGIEKGESYPSSHTQNSNTQTAKREAVQGVAARSEVSRKDNAKKDSIQKGAKVERKPKKKFVWIIAALIPIAIIAAFIIRNIYMKHETKTFTAGFPNSVLWGAKEVEESRISSLTQAARMKTWQMGEGEYELSVIPFYIEVDPQNDANVMVLGFVDKNGKKYYTYGEYTCSGATLYRTRNKSTVPYTIENVVVTPSDNKTFSSGNKDLLALGEEVKFKLRLNMNGYMFIHDMNSDVRLELTNPKAEEAILTGKAVTDADKCDDIAFFYVDGDKGIAQIIYADGSYTIGGTGSLYNKTNSVSMRADERMVVYNGSPTKEKKYIAYGFDYVDTYPYGCVIIEDEKYYCYQNVGGIADSEILSTGGLGEGDPREFLKSVGLLIE